MSCEISEKPDGEVLMVELAMLLFWHGLTMDMSWVVGCRKDVVHIVWEDHVQNCSQVGVRRGGILNIFSFSLNLFSLDVKS